MEEYIKFWKNYLNFKGRATRKEFWLPALINFVILGIIGTIDMDLESVVSLIILIPNLANFVRRMHDVNKSGYEILWMFVPIIGWIIILISLCSASVDDGNIYSDN